MRSRALRPPWVVFIRFSSFPEGIRRVLRSCPAFWSESGFDPGIRAVRYFVWFIRQNEYLQCFHASGAYHAMDRCHHSVIGHLNLIGQHNVIGRHNVIPATINDVTPGIINNVSPAKETVS